MKAAIHPSYRNIRVTCACGNSFEAGSTLTGDLSVEICAACHPLYTGKSKLVDTAGRVDKFRARTEQAAAAKLAADVKAAAKADSAPERDADAKA